MQSNTFPSFSSITEQYIDLRTPIVREGTLTRIYRPTFRSWLTVLPDRPINTYTKLDVQAFVARRLKTVSRTSVNINLRVLKAFGRWCTEMEVLPERNTFATIKQLRVDEQPIRYLTMGEFKAILEAEPLAKYRALYTVALLTGLRLGTVLSLRWSWIDLGQKVLTVRNEDDFRTKNGQCQTIPLSDTVVEVLRRQPQNSAGLVFVNEHHVFPTKLSRDYVTHRFKRTAVAAGFPDVKFHTLRKSFGSLLLRSDVNILKVSRLLGHSSLAVTMKHYANLLPAELAEDVNRLRLTTT